VLESKPRPTTIAKQMIRRHGLQANAVAQERETLARLPPDAEALSLWRSVQRSISELGSTAIPAALNRAQPALGSGV
jgi:hypothetical protein